MIRRCCVCKRELTPISVSKAWQIIELSYPKKIVECPFCHGEIEIIYVPAKDGFQIKKKCSCDFSFLSNETFNMIRELKSYPFHWQSERVYFFCDDCFEKMFKRAITALEL